jgi:hypothetical protein
MRQPVLHDGVLERTHDVLLTDDLIESAGPIFTGEDRVTHAANRSRRRLERDK